MKKYFVTIEHDYYGVYDGVLVADKLEIGDIVTIQLNTKALKYKRGTVIMFEEMDNHE